MIQRNSLTTSQMALAAGCSKQSILYIRSNLQVFGNVRAPRNGAGRRRSITQPMLDALCEHLMEKPTLYQDEMALFLWDEFGKRVTIQSISRALASVGWSKKAARQIAKERNVDLRDFFAIGYQTAIVRPQTTEPWSRQLVRRCNQRAIEVRTRKRESTRKIEAT